LKKKIYIGLVAITFVFILGGALISRSMDQLYSVNHARFLIEEVCHTTIRLDSMAFHNSYEPLQEGAGESWTRRTVDDVNRLEVLLDDLNEKVITGDLANRSCGTCHEIKEDLFADLYELVGYIGDTHTELSRLVSALVSGDIQSSSDQLRMEIGRGFEKYQNYVEVIQSIVLPMVDHTNEKVGDFILRTRRVQEITVILITLLIFAGMALLVTTIAGPLKQLTRGTEAIVQGDYDFRIKVDGRDEAAVLAERFNYMAETLSNREKNLYQKTLEMEELNRTLEGKVRDRTKALLEKQEELNRKYVELESVNSEMQASYLRLKTTTAELGKAQEKLQEHYDVLKIMNEEFQRANEVKNKFLSIMSHELRTPLTVINGYLSLVLDKDYGRPGTELRDLLKVVKEQGHIQLSLIEDLLDLSRIEAGEFKLQKLSLEVDDLIAKAVENFRPKYEEKSISVNVDADEDLPTVYWDFQKMLQVFQNLLDNALKFTSEGGKIDISAHYKSDFVEVKVRDNGIGIPRDQIDRVFERFFQVDSSSTRQFNGSGLGLSIVREIILAHQGKIFVESEEGKGTSFLILLPIGEPDRSRVVSKIAKKDLGERPHEGPKGNGELILVVDDDEAFLKMMNMILPREGYKVSSTADPTRVVEQVRDLNADLVMLDIMMPEVDGFEVSRRLRADDKVGDIPILVVSATGSDDAGRRIFEAGADGHVTKPFDQRDLLYHINTLLKGKVKRGREDNEGSDEGTKS
jgi:signal transduction histidine kinase/ActR/RegA family two-component response regulator